VSRIFAGARRAFALSPLAAALLAPSAAALAQDGPVLLTGLPLPTLAGSDAPQPLPSADAGLALDVDVVRAARKRTSRNAITTAPRGSAAVAVKSFRASGSALILGDVEREDAR